MKSSSFDDLNALINEIKTEIKLFNVNSINPYLFISPSPYDTACLAMIEKEEDNDLGFGSQKGVDNLQTDTDEKYRKPMFLECLDWVVSNQDARDGSWGRFGTINGTDQEEEDMYVLVSTFACVVALHKWDKDCIHLQKGKKYIEKNTENIIGKCKNEDGSYPHWFLIKFTQILQFAQQLGLQFLFSIPCIQIIKHIFYQRQQIHKRDDLYQDSLMEFQSPSAIAAGFMITPNTKCEAYLRNLVQRCPNGVPEKYPLDEELIKLTMADLIENLGLGEYFGEEIEQICKNFEVEDVEKMSKSSMADQLHKDALAFRMLRLHGYEVSPRRFCWFLNHQETQDHIERNVDSFFHVILSVYRATDLMFPGEHELQEARNFAQNILKKTRFFDEQMVKHELNTPWIARLKHLDHRMWIEDKNLNTLSFENISLKLTNLAARNFEYKQAIYRRELEELTIWVKKSGLSDIGFGREKTTYCYFAASSSISLPFKSAINVRKLTAKSGILITVADDFFDEEGSFDELKALTNAVLRWEGEELEGHSKIIFKALDDLVKETAMICFNQHGINITKSLQNIWSETFESWFREAEWIKNGETPSMEEYLKNGMISIAAHTIVLPMSCLMDPCLPQNKLEPRNYDKLTTLLMTIARLLNDLQSYQKEEEQGKINSVLLHNRKHSGIKIEESIDHIEKLIDLKRKEFLKHVLMDGVSDLPKMSKDIHMSCLNVFEMFFNKRNRFDSNTELVKDIKKALYDPLNVHRVSKGNDEDMNVQIPTILESKMKKGEFGVEKSRMCLKRYSADQRRIVASRLDFGFKALKIDVAQTKLMKLKPRFSMCFY